MFAFLAEFEKCTAMFSKESGICKPKMRTPLCVSDVCREELEVMFDMLMT